MIWHPLISLIAGLLGSLAEGALGGSRSPGAWLARGLLPVASGAAWTALVGSYVPGPGLTPYQHRRLAVDFAIYTAFSLTAWVGVYAVRRAREEDAA